jgi:hypothetical protein
MRTDVGVLEDLVSVDGGECWGVLGWVVVGWGGGYIGGSQMWHDH